MKVIKRQQKPSKDILETKTSNLWEANSVKSSQSSQNNELYNMRNMKRVNRAL